MKNKPNFFLTGVSQTGGGEGGVPPLGNFSHIIPFFSDHDPKSLLVLFWPSWVTFVIRQNHTFCKKGLFPKQNSG